VKASSLLRDTRGEATTSTLGFALTWFCVFFVFLMNVQLGQLFHRRDVVDHAAAVAADTAKKTYCANEENTSATEQQAKQSVQAVLDTAGGNQACQLKVQQGGEGGSDPGAKGLEVSLECNFDCKVPIASLVMCKSGKSKLEAKLKTVALGCDGKGS
jgi:hypothetical protein